MKNTINYEIAKDMINEMPANKKASLRKVLERNFYFTSVYSLEFGKITVYKEGFLLTLEGTKCKFFVYAKDNDGDLEFTRKPNENELHELYSEILKFDESFYEDFKNDIMKYYYVCFTNGDGEYLKAKTDCSAYSKARRMANKLCTGVNDLFEVAKDDRIEEALRIIIQDGKEV